MGILTPVAGRMTRGGHGAAGAAGPHRLRRPRRPGPGAGTRLRGVSALLLHHGIVHSPSDPYATALILEAGTITWLGGDDTAASFLRDGMSEQDLDGAVVVPLFVDPLSSGAAGAAARGVGLATVLRGWEGDRTLRGGAQPADAPDTAPAAATDAAEEVSTVEYRALEEADGGPAAGVWIAADALGDSALEEAVVTAVRAGEQVYLVPSDLADPASVAAAQAGSLAALRAAEKACGIPAIGRTRPRLAVGGPLSAEEEHFLAGLAASVTAVVDAAGRTAGPVGSLLAGAVPVCLSLAGDPNPWAAVRAALHHPEPEQGVSARSAFTAATRTGLRALSDTPASRVGLPARLAVSEPATFGVWEADAVTVQAPDGRVAAWSTDTRAGTPLLPSLDRGEDLPRLQACWIDGRELTGRASA